MHNSVETKKFKKKLALQMKGVSISYAQHQLLQDVSFELFESETLTLIGPSGSGKSTLLRSLAGLEEIQKGIIYVDSQVLKPFQKPKEIGIVFQSYNLFPHLTVLENLILAPQKVLRIKKKEAIEKAFLLLSKVDLHKLSHRYPSELSGGQEQRVAILRALMMEPKILLFDEPTSALDPEMTQEVLEVIQNLTESGITTLIVTHQMGFAKKISHQVAFLDHGEIIEIGATQDFFASPKKERTKAFLDRVLRY